MEVTVQPDEAVGKCRFISGRVSLVSSHPHRQQLNMSTTGRTRVIEPLRRQTSVNDAAMAVVGVPEIERCLTILLQQEPVVENETSTSLQESEKQKMDLLDQREADGEKGQGPPVTFPDGGLRVRGTATTQT